MSQDREVRNSRLFGYPAERVFDAFADPSKLKLWWGPNGFRNTFHKFDFRPGGDWILTMHGPDGRDHENHNIFSEIDRPNRITISHVSAPKFVLEVNFEESPEGTIVEWIQRFETPEIRDRLAEFIRNANEENFDRLAAVLAAADRHHSMEEL